MDTKEAGHGYKGGGAWIQRRRGMDIKEAGHGYMSVDQP